MNDLTVARGSLDLAIEAYDVFIDAVDGCERAFRTHTGRVRWHDERGKLQADIVEAARKLREIEKRLVTV